MNDISSRKIILENRRARLTPLTWNDTGPLSSIAFEPSIWTWGMSNLTDNNDLENYISTALEERQIGLSYPFVIWDKLRHSIAGSTRYGNISLAHKRLEIGWSWIHPRFQGSGLNKSVKYLLLKYAFEILEMNRVELKTDVLNIQSRRAILKIGAKEEGIFRKHQITSSGRVRDSIYFSIISEEWQGLKNSLFTDE